MKVFIDTGAFFALQNRKDPNHHLVSEKYQFYKRERVSFFTSDYILDEYFTLSLARIGLFGARMATKFISSIVSANEITVIYIDSVVFHKAQEIFVKYAEHKISFTDAIVFVLYKNFAIDEVFTLDSDFKKIGVRTSF